MNDESLILDKRGEENGDSTSSQQKGVIEDFPKTSNTQSLMHLLKAFIGSGILSLPIAIKNAGLWTGMAGIVLIGMCNAHCMLLLVSCSRIITSSTGVTSLDYSHVVYMAFLTGPERLQFMAPASLIFMNVVMCCTQFAFCSVYILFIGDNMRQVFIGWFNVDLESIVYMVIASAITVPIVWIRSLKTLAPVSTVANLLQVMGLVLVLQYCLQDLPDVSSYPAFASWSTLPVFFSMTIYSFEGIGVVLPIRDKMLTPSEYSGFTGVLNTSQMLTSLAFLTIAFYGYAKAGADTQAAITLNLPGDDPLYLCVRLVFSLAMLVSYALQFYVGFQIVWRFLQPRLPCGTVTSQLATQRAAKVVFVLIIFWAAASIPHLDLMSSLIGAISSTLLAIIIPPVAELLLRWPDWSFGRGCWILYKDLFLIIFGLLGFFTGTVVSIINIINAFGDERPSA